jgi:hypothetical protein
MTIKKIKSDLVVEGEQEIALVAPLPRKDIKYYDRASWKGVKEVFRCETCGTCRDDEDSMIEHVLLHIPLAEQEKVFNQLIKEKK